MFWHRKPDKQDILTRVAAVTAGKASPELVIQGRDVLLALTVPAGMAPSAREEMRQQVEDVLAKCRAVASYRVVMTAERHPADNVSPVAADTKNSAQERPVAAHIRHIIAVASGKGGVGKSMVAANLAVALSRAGLRTGLLDADIYGPSVPLMLGVRREKPQQDDTYLLPVRAHGLALMSMGFLVDEKAPMIWRGPMVQTALLQMLRDVRWGSAEEPLDVLVVDMPPGTGDAQLTLAQKVPLSGAVIVSTPQDIALLDAVKAIEMFRKVKVPVLGLVENMSYFCCPNCQHQTAIFGQDGARLKAEEMDVGFLGAIPLDGSVREMSDAGTPVSLQDGHPVQESFAKLAYDVRGILDNADHPALERADIRRS